MADYQYQEYPKHVYPDPADPKTYVVVRSEDEEATALAGSPVIRDADERARLVALAGVNGVQVDKRWRLDKIAAAITDAGFDASANPFE